MNKSTGLAGDPPGAWREVVDAEGGLGVGDGALEAGGRVLGLRVQLHGVARLQPPRVARLEIELETKVHNVFTISVETAHPLSSLPWKPNFMSTYCGLTLVEHSENKSQTLIDAI